MSEFDKLLEDVARELAEMGASNRSWQARDNCEVLKRRLLGLLEAGENMRQTIRHAETYEEDLQAARRWDEQKQAAMEGR